MGWRDLMAPLRRATDELGPIMPGIAAATGIRPDCPVFCGIHDSNASLLPHLMAEQRPFSVVSTGTWVIAMAVGGAAIDLDPTRDTLINVDAFGDAVPSARFMGGREHELLLGGGPAEYCEADLGVVLREGIMVLPCFEPGMGPFPDRRGHWTVAPETLPAGQRAAAIACYMSLMTATCLDVIGAEGPILVEGAFAGDPDLMRLIAAVTGRPVRCPSAGSTGTSVGAALLARPTLRMGGDSSGECAVSPDFRAVVGHYASEWTNRL